MLTIDRKKGESVFIGDDELKVKEVHSDNVIVEFKKQIYRVRSGQSVSVGRVELFMFKRFNDKVRLGFDGPRELYILRKELYDKSSTKYIDNSTKQFPSGGNF